MKIDGPIGIKCADIYLRFPEIMEEEFDELIEFLNDNNIRCEGVTKEYKQLKSTLEELKVEITRLMTMYFYEKDFCIEDVDLDNLLQIIDKGVNND